MAKITNSSTFHDLISEATEVEQLATGFGWTEGPVWNPEGYLLSATCPETSFARWGTRRTTSRTGADRASMANGLTLTPSDASSPVSMQPAG